MQFESVERPAGAYQQSLTADQVEAVVRRAFGRVSVVSAIELGDGTYNSTYRLALDSGLEAVLRVAPTPERQFRSERAFMRNEHAAAPYFAPIAALLPHTLAVDFTHDLMARDYMIQSIVPGVPARIGLQHYPRREWAWFFRDLGAITRRIHAVPGAGFGPLVGPSFATWGEAVHAGLTDLVADLEQVHLEASDARELAATALRRREVLDEVREPRLLHGDLWTINTMLVPDARHPTVSGLFDCDRVCWGDPESDWAIYRAAGRPGTERDAFWETYGPLGTGARARWRRLLYEARNVFAGRLERHRLGLGDKVAASYHEAAAALERLKAAEPR
ncbi:MAG TPA: aminoglycoside phosphotransferase family protein [Actinospica sp.]|nr:aminoglycoside phosphotransferase family protein [Actinospica sp.]